MSTAQMSRAHEHYLPGVPYEIEPSEKTLHDLLRDAVRDYPDRIAIDFLGCNYTYYDFDRLVRKSAAALALNGVRKGDVVGVILPNCVQHMALFHGATALGAIVAEHNPLASPAELQAQMKAHGAKVVVAWEKTIAKLIEADVVLPPTTLSVDLTQDLPATSRMLLKLPLKAARTQREKLRHDVSAVVPSWSQQMKDAPALDVSRFEHPSPDDTAVLIHTGGTTGSPKAVMLSHRNLVANSQQCIDWCGVRRGAEVFGAVLPFFHAFGLTESIVIGIQAAATQVVQPQFDVDMLLAGYRRHPITFFVGVAPMFDRLLKAAKERKQPLDAVKVSISGAMALDGDLAAAWEEYTGGLIIEGYGMTEASPVISGSPVSIERRPGTLGVPLPSTEVKIIDPEHPDRVMPDGEIGEIAVRGPQVFQGYFLKPEETAEVMLPDGYLRTGDLARWDDGFLVMADRRKELIINGGFNIYPSQVESALADMPGISDVAVVGVPNETRGEQVVAALVLEPGATVDLASVRAWAEKRISHYALPKSIAIFDKLPRSPIGKVMRREVRADLNELDPTTGVWSRLSQLPATASSTFEELMDSIRKHYNASSEQLTAWLREKGFIHRDEESNEKASEEIHTQDRSWFEAHGLTSDGFREWLARQADALGDSLTSASESLREGMRSRQHDEANDEKAGHETATSSQAAGDSEGASKGTSEPEAK